MVFHSYPHWVAEEDDGPPNCLRDRIYSSFLGSADMGSGAEPILAVGYDPIRT